MFSKGSLKERWLKAQGWDRHHRSMLRNGDWYEPFPFTCCVCGQKWRPDKPEFVHVFGRAVYLVPINETAGMDSIPRDKLIERPFWYATDLQMPQDTGDMRDQIRHICREHSDRWPFLRDCLTNEVIHMDTPLSLWRRAWRDAKHWTLTITRFIGMDCIEFAERLRHLTKQNRYYTEYKRRNG